jgi:hypothetical protein
MLPGSSGQISSDRSSDGGEEVGEVWSSAAWRQGSRQRGSLDTWPAVHGSASHSSGSLTATSSPERRSVSADAYSGCASPRRHRDTALRRRASLPRSGRIRPGMTRWRAAEVARPRERSGVPLVQRGGRRGGAWGGGRGGGHTGRGGESGEREREGALVTI